ncbi:MAG: ROK family protein, partial [Clostridia bacterium]|nr:ROK family protein [Clostridia bacterium]
MIGFDIGGTKCAVTVGEEKDGGLIVSDKTVFATDLTLSPYEIIDRMCAAAGRMTADCSKIGISCGGPLDSRNGVILSPPNLPGWDNVEIVRYVEQKTGGRATLQNDANASALAEWRYGAGKGSRNMIFLTFGTGLGAGLILDGKLYVGTCDMAGEVGHIALSPFGPVGYGKAGSFEGFCSGGGLAGLGRLKATEAFQAGKKVSYCETAADLERVTAKKIAECADKGWAAAPEIYTICGETLGRGLAVLVDILNPEKIILGSIYARSGHLLKDSMQRTLEKEALPASFAAVEILPSA